MDANSVKLVMPISSGGHGIVYKAVYQNRHVAVKLGLGNCLLTLQEVECMKELQHTGIVTLIGSYVEDGLVRIVMELYKGDWRTVILSSTYKYRAALQLLAAVSYIHSKQYCHGDIKPNNCLIDNHNNLKLGDFGFTVKLNSEGKYHGIRQNFTPGFGSLEVMKPQPVFSYASDMFAVGATIFFGLTRFYLFRLLDSETLVDIKRNIRKGLRVRYPTIVNGVTEWRFRKGKGMDYKRNPLGHRLQKLQSDPLANMIRAMVENNPNDRPTCEQVLAENPLYAICQFSRQNIFRDVQLSTLPDPIISVPHEMVTSSISVPVLYNTSRQQDLHHLSVHTSTTKIFHPNLNAHVSVQTDDPNINFLDQGTSPLSLPVTTEQGVQTDRIKTDDPNINFLDQGTSPISLPVTTEQGVQTDRIIAQLSVYVPHRIPVAVPLSPGTNTKPDVSSLSEQYRIARRRFVVIKRQLEQGGLQIPDSSIPSDDEDALQTPNLYKEYKRIRMDSIKQQDELKKYVKEIENLKGLLTHAKQVDLSKTEPNKAETMNSK